MGFRVENCDKARLRIHKTCKKEARIIKAILLATDTQKYDLANYLNMSDRTVRFWMQGNRFPNPKVRNSIEYFFNMDFDKIFHESNFFEASLIENAKRNYPTQVKKIKQMNFKKRKFKYKVFSGLVLFHKVNIRFLSESFQIPYRTLNESFYGNRKLPINLQYKLSGIFNVPQSILFHEEVTTRRYEMLNGIYSRRVKDNEQMEIIINGNNRYDKREVNSSKSNKER